MTLIRSLNAEGLAELAAFLRDSASATAPLPTHLLTDARYSEYLDVKIDVPTDAR